jgi:hypothetical protein
VRLNKLAKILSFFVIFLYTIECSATNNKNYISKQVSVNIISGTYEGEKGKAVFSYDPSKVKGLAEEIIEGNEITFTFLEQTVIGKPKILLQDGQFKDILWVSHVNGKKGKTFNFGFNEGFLREQFNGESEEFIQSGQSYFGYLDELTYVDGAGTIEYQN